MKHLLFAALMVLSTAGCASDDTAQTVSAEDPVVAESVRSRVDNPLTQDQINRALLTTADLQGFDSVGKEPGDEDDDLTGCPAIDRLGEMERTAAVKGEAKFTQGGELGIQVNQVIVAVPDDADRKFDEFAKGMADCTSFSGKTREGTQAAVTVKPLNMARLGDDTFAFKVTATTAFGGYNIDFIAFRAGDNIAFVSNGQFGATNESTTNLAAQRAIEKINDVR